MEPEVTLIGYKLHPNRPISVNGREDSEAVIWTIHITQFALAEDPKPGRNTISVVKADGSRFVLGTLVKDRCEQFTADFMIREDVKLIVSGQSEVHLTGYQTTTELLSPDEDFGGLSEDPAQLRLLEDAEGRLRGQEDSGNEDTEASSEEEGLDGSGEDEDELEDDSSLEGAAATDGLANGLAGAKQKLKAAKRKAELEAELERRLQQVGPDQDGSEDEDDEDDGDFDGEGESEDDLSAGDLAIDSEDDLSGDEDTEEDDPLPAKTKPGPADILKRKAAKEKKDKKPMAAALDAALEAPKQKKQKTDAAPAAAGKSTAQPTSEAAATPEITAWEAALRAFLSKEGPTALSKIGSSVKRPAGVPGRIKLKRVIMQSKKLLLDSDDMVMIKP